MQGHAARQAVTRIALLDGGVRCDRLSDIDREGVQLSEAQSSLAAFEILPATRYGSLSLLYYSSPDFDSM